MCRVPEVVGSISLAKAASRNQADARFLQHLHAVEHVRLLAFVLTQRKRNIVRPSEARYFGGIELFQ